MSRTSKSDLLFKYHLTTRRRKQFELLQLPVRFKISTKFSIILNLNVFNFILLTPKDGHGKFSKHFDVVCLLRAKQ